MPLATRSVIGESSVLFVSGSPGSIGHIYRVEHPTMALRLAGWRVDVIDLEDRVALEKISEVDLVVVFRARWGGYLSAVIEKCRVRDIPIAYDIDDLLFDQALTAGGGLALLDDLTEEDRRQWITESDLYSKALEASDAVVLTTPSLAEAASRYNPETHVLTNALSDKMEALAEAAVARPKLSSGDGLVRLLFASGTPSHQRDFRVVEEALACLMARHPHLAIRILGHLDVDVYPLLAPFTTRIERRPRVEFDQLPFEVSACDINLCPLETGNPFCESKSAVRCLMAAAVGVPTVATPTHPLREAIVEGGTGFLARSTLEWVEHIGRLVTEPALRASMGVSARRDALERYGFQRWRFSAVETYGTILEKYQNRKGSTL